MADSPEEIRKHLKFYLGIGVVLFVFTIITVLIARYDFGGHGINMLVGLGIATFKMSLVAVFFMHLKGEKTIIFKFLFFTIIFVLGLFVLTYLAFKDPIPQPW